MDIKSKDYFNQNSSSYLPVNSKEMGSSLGIYTNFSANREPRGFQPKKGSNLYESLEHINTSTGEVINTDSNGNIIFNSQEYRAKKYILQSAIRRILFGLYQVNNKSVQFRVTNCCRSIIPHKDLKVLKNKHDKAVFSGLMMCSSIWVCPVCGSKITERRALEVGSCIDGWLGDSDNNLVLMLTFTFPHNSNQPLRFLMDRLKKALHGFQKTRPVRDIKNKYGFFEAIKSPEVTFGHANGWHPHQHELWFLSLPSSYSQSELALFIQNFKLELFPHWQRYCQKNGLDLPSFEHGLDICMGENSQSYISKLGWDLASEITKTNMKKSKSDNRFSPYGLAEKFIKTNDIRYKKLFQEYACSTYGVQFLSRFPKLKKRYLVDDLTDEEISLSQDEDSIELGSITFYQWQKILCHSSSHVILSLTESKGWDYTKRYIRALPKPLIRKHSLEARA